MTRRGRVLQSSIRCGHQNRLRFSSRRRPSMPLVQAELGIPPIRCLFVSGNPWDSQAAKANGFPVLRVNRHGDPDEYGLRQGISWRSYLTSRAFRSCSVDSTGQGPPEPQTLQTIRLSKWASRNPHTDGSLEAVKSRCDQTIASVACNLIGHPQQEDFPVDAEAKMHSF